MSRHLVLMKLGGSLITDKTKPMTFLRERVDFIAQEVAALQQDDLHFVLGTGAGSFGHFPAHQYGLRSGASTSEQLFGMCVTHNAVQRLNNSVAEVFTEAHVPVFTTSPSALFSCRDKQVVKRNMDPVKNLLAQNIVPMVHGDTLTDTVRGTTIFSTEKALHECIKTLRTLYDKVTLIYLLDVDGVLDADGRVIPELTAKDGIALRGSLEHDVTGGIVGKVQSARAALEYVNAVYLVSGKIPGAIGKAIAGQSVGTRITA